MGWDVDEEIRRAQEAASQAMSPSETPEEKPSFFMRKAGPVPYWAIGVGALAVVGGGVYWVTR